MEACPSHRPWHDKETHETFLKPTSGKCLHFHSAGNKLLSKLCENKMDNHRTYKGFKFFSAQDQALQVLPRTLPTALVGD